MGIFIRLSLVLACSLATFAQFTPPELFRIDLDTNPEMRFFNVTLRHSGLLVLLGNAIMKTIDTDLNDTIKSVYGDYVKAYPERMKETAGVALAMHVNPVVAFAIELLYEIDAGCTALLAKDKNGDIILSHNLDFTLAGLFRKAYISADYIKDHKVLFSCSGIAGYIGVLMCVKHGKFSITINERATDGDIENVKKNLREIRPLTTWVMRSALTSDGSYFEAVRRINGTKTVSGSYVTIAGTKDYEGIVLTRGPDATKHEESLNATNRFLVQCNSDWNNFTNDVTNRTARAKEMMTLIPQKEMTLKAMFDRVLKKYPILRNESDYGTIGTISSVFMGPNAEKIVSCIYEKGKDDTCGPPVQEQGGLRQSLPIASNS